MKELVAVMERLGVRAEIEYPLSACSGFRIGGSAALALFPHTREHLIKAVLAVRQSGVPFWVIGNATNVVFPDNGFSGAVLFTGACNGLSVNSCEITADAGASLASLARAAQRSGLTGLEFAHGIPGTLGGAVKMNAGAYGRCIQDVCVSSAYLDLSDGSVHTCTGEAQGFSYRSSMYQQHSDYVILGATFRLEARDPCEIDRTMEDLKQRRRSSQPLEYPSAGSVFKRPVGHFAGRLVEDCGWKGKRVGGAEVSQKHAGFIINRGGATAKDVKTLVEMIQADVLAKTGVALECEIQFL